MKRSLLAAVFLASLALAKTFTLEQVLSAPFPLELILTSTPAKTFTLEQVLSAPFPSELIAASGGGKVAWLLNERGARNIWVAAAPDFKGVRLTNYTRDDGQDMGQLRWTPDANAVVYVRGGDLEFLGRPDPNPTADPAGVDQSIWIAAPGEAPRKIAAGHSPVVSPKGDQVAYLLGGQIWLAPLSGTGGPSLLIHSRAGGGGRGGRRAGDPWTIRAASVTDGVGRQVWKADPGAGSLFRAVSAESQLVWTAANRIVFPWEHDGWTHLYSVPAEGGATLLLTPGEFEVEHVSFSADASEIVYSSNQVASDVLDVDRRHIWRVSSAGGHAPAAVTGGKGLEWSPVLVTGGLAYFRADAKLPARAAMDPRRATGDLAPETIPADFPAADLVVPEQVIYTATDGMPVHAQLFLPPAGAAAAKHPALVFMHGGSRRQMLLGWHYMDYYNNAYGMNQYLASQGYVVLSINYRSGTGYGLNFREAVNYGASGAREFHPVEGAGLSLRTRADVDAARIGLWGGSYGGYLTALGLARASSLFAAGVDFHGVHDWSTRLTANTDAARTALESSPMASVRTWRSPVLLIHGDDDRNVNFSETVTLANALRQQGVYFEQLILPDEIHSFLRHASWLRGSHAAADFLRRKL